MIIYNYRIITVELLKLIRYSDASAVHASGTEQLHANSLVAGPKLSSGKSTRRAVATMGLMNWSWSKTTWWDRVVSGVTGKRADESR